MVSNPTSRHADEMDSTSFWRQFPATIAFVEPIQITGKRGNAVLVSEADWANIQETLHLAAIPGMGASIRRGMKEPLKKASKKLRW